MNNQSTAQVLPVQTLPQRRQLSISRTRPQKPRKHANCTLSSEFEPEIAKQMLQGFFPELSEAITQRTTVTCRTDESGVNMVLSCPDFQISVIYTEMNGGAAQ